MINPLTTFILCADFSTLHDLEWLSIRGCKVDPSAAQVAIGALPTLTSLDMSYVLKLDALYEEDMRKLTKLRTLELEGCPLVANLAVVDALLALPHLTVLNLAGCPLLTGYLLTALSRVLTVLEVLDLSYCAGIATPPETLPSLARFSSLRILDVGGAKDDRGAVVKKIVPNVRVFD